MPSLTLCPSCNDRLPPDADRCSCGWTRRSSRGAAPEWNHTCTWSYGSERCVHPVGLFRAGEKSGLCIFHRANPSGTIAAQIARDSHDHDQESYNYAARSTVGAHGAYAEKLREKFAEHKGRRSGNLLQGVEKFIEMCRQRGTQA